jgi:SHS2 domain-containing protein
MTFRIFEHTADLGIEADGDDAGECLSNAALALTQIVTGKDHHATAPDREITFSVEAPDMDALAVAFLSELLWILDAKGLLWLNGGAAVTLTDDGFMVTAAGNGRTYDASIHGQGTEVKAITYHELAFRPHGPGWRLRVVVDI